MGGGGSVLFADADDFQAHLPMATQLLVTGAGDFRAHLTWMELTDLHLFHAWETVSRIAYVSLPAEQVFFWFPKHRTSRLIYDGVPVRMGDFVFHGLGERFHQRTEDRTEWGSIALSAAWLRAYRRTLTHRDLAPPARGQILRPLPADRKRLFRLYAEAARIAQTRLRHLEHPEVARAVEQELIGALVTCLTNAEPCLASAITHRCAKILDQFEDALIVHTDRVSLMSEICEAIQISESTLSACCKELLGMEPARYWHLRRLERVRAALLNANPETDNEGEVIKRHGFAELHCFMTAYRDAFGQFPRLDRRPFADRRM
jgi:AraC-like DNA-binding protein